MANAEYLRIYADAEARTTRASARISLDLDRTRRKGEGEARLNAERLKRLEEDYERTTAKLRHCSCSSRRPNHNWMSLAPILLYIWAAPPIFGHPGVLAGHRPVAALHYDINEAFTIPLESRFSSVDDIDALLSHIISAAIPPSTDMYRKISAFLKSVKVTDSQTARDAARIGDHHLRVIFNAIANAGLHVFEPDVFGNVESIYNLVHEHVVGAEASEKSPSGIQFYSNHSGEF
ncbi:hypothetical protein DFH07DRAFT_771429 [Mycena maculata]|uniref:Uncharacterized protein n=1 Tax=Mycena maculata TaxID=230809 RepID=A0AAD7NGP4_9AGAR|nr:hypothetical protein DFH07DRAFT_771429 [Mycena maculata]